MQEPGTGEVAIRVITLLVLLLAAAAAVPQVAAWAPLADDAHPKAVGSGTPTTEERLAALEAVIRGLQARIQELEGKGPAGPVPASESGPASDSGAVATTAASPPSFFDKTVVSGSVDAYYGFNFNRPASHRNALRNFDVNHNQYSLNLLEFAIERAAEPFGFRADFNFGDAAKMVHASEPAGTDLHQFLQQAYIS